MSWGIVLLAGAALIAGDQKPAEAPKAAAEKKVCRAEQTTGTRLQRKRTCVSRKVWEEQREANKEAAARNADPTGRAPAAASVLPR